MKITNQVANKLVENAVARCIRELLANTDVYRATSFIHGKLVVNVTRTFRFDGRNSRETFVITYGRPNYAECKFINTCRVAGEPFPLKRIQLKFYPQKRKAA